MAFCEDCPIKDTEYCNIVNPNARRYTRIEKDIIRKELDAGRHPPVAKRGDKFLTGLNY